jgi:hypothetical protein
MSSNAWMRKNRFAASITAGPVMVLRLEIVSDTAVGRQVASACKRPSSTLLPIDPGM